MTIRTPTYTLTIYKLRGDRSIPVSAHRITVMPSKAWEALEAVRAGLPSDHGASMVDGYGNRVQPP